MNNKKIKNTLLKFFAPVCAVLLWQPNVSVAAETHISKAEVANFAPKSGLRDSEILMLKMSHEKRLLEEYLKAQREIAKRINHDGSLSKESFTTDINVYNYISGAKSSRKA